MIGVDRVFQRFLAANDFVAALQLPYSAWRRGEVHHIWGLPAPWNSLPWGEHAMGQWLAAIFRGEYAAGPPLSPGRLKPLVNHDDPGVRAWVFLVLAAAPLDGDATREFAKL